MGLCPHIARHTKILVYRQKILFTQKYYLDLKLIYEIYWCLIATVIFQEYIFNRP